MCFTWRLCRSRCILAMCQQVAAAMYQQWCVSGESERRRRRRASLLTCAVWVHGLNEISKRKAERETGKTTIYKNNATLQLKTDGSVTDGHQKIANYRSEFWGNFNNFKFSPRTSFDVFDSSPSFNQLDEADGLFCENTEAINNLTEKKLPGTDGFTAGFYKPKRTLCQGLVSLIPKPREDPLILDNWLQSVCSRPG